LGYAFILVLVIIYLFFCGRVVTMATDTEADDVDWIDNEQRILHIQQNPVREPLTSIRGVFLFINQHQYIDKIVVENIVRGDTDPEKHEFRLPFSRVLQLVQAKKYVTANTKYIFKEVCLFHVDLDAEHVQGFVNEEETGGADSGVVDSRFFRVLPSTEDIVIPPAIFIFHTVSALYFYFTEVPLKRASLPKSILRPPVNTGTKGSDAPAIPHNVTKKRVRLTVSTTGGTGRVRSTRKNVGLLIGSRRSTRKHISEKT